MKRVYSQQAVADLVRLRGFIATEDPSAAARIAAELVARIGNLGALPHMGHEVVQAEPPAVVRDMTFDSHTVRYSVHPAAVVVLRLWHHREDHE